MLISNIEETCSNRYSRRCAGTPYFCKAVPNSNMNVIDFLSFSACEFEDSCCLFVESEFVACGLEVGVCDCYLFVMSVALEGLV